MAKITSDGIDAVERYEELSKKEAESKTDSSELNTKKQTIWIWIKKSWIFILGLLAFIVLVSDAINGWPVITEFINSTLT
ncbi:MAG: hypothetical protein R2741_15380 [Methanolobus sp.]